MKPQEQLKQQSLKEQQLMARLQRAASQVDDAEQERIRAIVAAHPAGLSIRKIAGATGLSSSRGKYSEAVTRSKVANKLFTLQAFQA